MFEDDYEIEKKSLSKTDYKEQNNFNKWLQYIEITIVFDFEQYVCQMQKTNEDRIKVQIIQDGEQLYFIKTSINEMY